MALFGKKTDNRMRVDALVIEADPPVHNAPPFGNVGRSEVRILVDAGSGGVEAVKLFHLNRHQWLIPGMRVPVTLDPAKPNDFDVDWTAVPEIEERAAANDPLLADPVTRRANVVAAMRAVGINLPGPNATAADKFAKSLADASSLPAPAGKRRAVVRISSIRSRLVSEDSGPSYLSTEGRLDAVLAVTVPGQAPYAVFVKGFTKKRGRTDVLGAGYPAVVSTSDPTDVDVLWDEVPATMDQVGQRLTEDLEAASSRLPMGMPQLPFTAPAAGAPVGMNPDMLKMMADNAKLSLSMIRDPNVRAATIAQYRAAGIPIEED
ncbi:MAG: hypothetical protein ABJB03_11620 [Rhodoglobus sp.]